MAFDFLTTVNLLQVVQGLDRPASFLRDRYFPTNAATDIFSTNKVLAEYRDGSKKLAPFVAPRVGGVTMTRKGFEMVEYEPPKVAPRRVMTLDDLDRRGFGEALYSNYTPQMRQNMLITRDLEELSNAISRREEAMAAEVMQTNGFVVNEIADDVEEARTETVKFYSEGSNPASYTPATMWDKSGAKVMADLEVMVRMLTTRGLPAVDLVCAPDVADAIIRNAEVQTFLDNRRYEMGYVEPTELAFGAAIIARLNVLGRLINIISYDDTYTDDEGTDHQYITAGNCVLTCPGAGRTLYGAVTQLEQSDHVFHTYTGMRVPKYVGNVEADQRKLTLTSRPMMVPNNKNPFIVAKVLGE